MALKVILVHLDPGPRWETRLELAITLAQTHKAHLSGFYASGSPGYGLVEPEAAEIRKIFEQKVSNAGISADWIDGYSIDPPLVPLMDKFLLRICYADLVIVGQQSTRYGNRSLPPDFTERVIISAGRPVLVIPKHGNFAQIGERVMVAWRGGRISSRALHDAIPLLAKARQVALTMVNPGSFYQSEVETLTTYLAHNQINASCHRVLAKDPGTGDILLNQVSELGADLLVVGLFYQFRRGKIDLGPVGRHILNFMTIPTLFSG
ncbi:MAG: universal stress protein [Deltaproteobacteria bacterium]|nr:universal stress protein [Deltaproteobacteria bacterium]NCP03838.1 universal stress protein [Deltaproteobacteria bacterium]